MTGREQINRDEEEERAGDGKGGKGRNSAAADAL